MKTDLFQFCGYCCSVHFSSFQSLSCVRLYVVPLTAAHQAFLSITNPQSLLKLMPIESVMPSNHLILVVPFSSCLQSFPASGAFPMSQLFTSGGQSIRTSALASVFVVNIQCWFPFGLTGLISLLFKGLSRVFSNTTAQKHQSVLSLLYCPVLTFVHDYWKNHSLDYTDLCWQSNVSAF